MAFISAPTLHAFRAERLAAVADPFFVTASTKGSSPPSSRELSSTGGEATAEVEIGVQRELANRVAADLAALKWLAESAAQTTDEGYARDARWARLACVFGAVFLALVVASVVANPTTRPSVEDILVVAFVSLLTAGTVMHLRRVDRERRDRVRPMVEWAEKLDGLSHPSRTAAPAPFSDQVTLLSEAVYMAPEWPRAMERATVWGPRAPLKRLDHLWAALVGVDLLLASLLILIAWRWALPGWLGFIAMDGCYLALRGRRENERRRAARGIVDRERARWVEEWHSVQQEMAGRGRSP